MSPPLLRVPPRVSRAPESQERGPRHRHRSAALLGSLPDSPGVGTQARVRGSDWRVAMLVTCWESRGVPCHCSVSPRFRMRRQQ